MGRGARNIDHLALVRYILHMNAITLHFFSMAFADIYKDLQLYMRQNDHPTKMF